MRKCIYLTLFAALVIASPKAHAVSVTGNLVPSATIAADGSLPGLIAGGTLLDVYSIFLNSDDPNADMTAFDLTFSGSWAQVQLGDGFGSSIPSPQAAGVPGGAAGLAQDTHIVPPLTLPGLPEPPPTEGLTGFAGTGTGFGPDLDSNAVAIAGVAQAPSVLIAQIVVLKGGMGSFAGTVAVEGITTPIPVSGLIGVPEPSTLVLAGLSLVGAFTSRRRRNS